MKISLITAKNLCVLSSCLFLVACSDLNESKYQKIQASMSTKEVIDILGEPTSTTSINVGGINGTALAWKGRTHEIDVEFLNDKVAVKTFNDSGAALTIKPNIAGA